MKRFNLCLLVLSLTCTLEVRAQDANFDSLIEGPLAGTIIVGGITFQNLDVNLTGSTPTFLCEEADGNLTGFPGFTSPNCLGWNIYTAGPQAAFGRVLSFEMTTGQTQGQASVEVFDLGSYAGNTITLDALMGHTVVASQTVPIQTGGTFHHYSLSVSGVPFDLVRVRGGGPSDNGVFFGLVDSVHFGPLPPGNVFCSGDGTGTACPCGNASATGAGEGCSSSLGFGATLRASGTSSLSADTLALNGTQMPNAPCLYFQGTTQANGGAGSVFGDGLRCAGGSIVRLSTATNSGGGSQYPSGTQSSVSVRGQVTTPGVRDYQVWYRNAAAFCTPSTFNLTNGLEITWAP